MHERGLGKAMFGTVIGGGRVKQKSLLVVTVDPLNMLELPVDEDIIDPLNPDDDIGVTTFIVEEKLWEKVTLHLVLDDTYQENRTIELEYFRTIRKVCICKCLFCSHHVLCFLYLLFHICCQRVKKLR